MIHVLQHTLDFQNVKVTNLFYIPFYLKDLLKLSFSIACGCNKQGVESGDQTCDKNGKCNCKCDVTGDKCDICEVGHQGFPDCHGNLKCF